MNSTTSTPLVSIALCTFNGSRFLAEQLQSIVSQTHCNLEIVVVDDCSSDDSAAIVAGFAAKDARIRLHRNRENVGFAANFSAALGMCSGEFIAPCDQDDIWESEKIAVLLEFIGSRALVYGDSTLVDGEGKPTGVRMAEIVRPLTTDDPSPFMFGNCVSGHAMLFRRQILELALPVPSGFFYDWWIAAVAATTGGVGFCPRALVRYRQHGSNVTQGRLAEMQADAGLQSRVVRESQPGDRLRYLREAQARLDALANLPGPNQAFMAQLLRLWRARETQWLSLRLWRLMTRERKRLLALSGMSEKKSKRYCRDFVWGLRFKRLTDPRRYGAAPRA